MPIAGAVGAIHAGRRAANRRHPSGKTSSFTGSAQLHRMKMSYPDPAPVQVPMKVQRDPVVTKTKEFSETASVTSVGSKSSVLSMFRKQVEETGGFFKKKQQAFTDTVKKSLGVVSGSAAAQDAPKQAVADTLAAPSTLKPKPVAAVAASTNTVAAAKSKLQQPELSAHLVETKRKNAEWMNALKQMGFEQWDIVEAVSKLGGSPKSVEDILEVLVARQNASFSTASSSSSSSSASSDTFVVNLKKGPNDRLGITVDTSDIKHIIVESVSEGLVQRWNAANPYLQVKAGAYILDVNNSHGKTSELVDVLLHASSLSLLIKPGPIAVPASSAPPSAAPSSAVASALSSASSRGKRDQRRVSFCEDTAVICSGKSAFAQAFALPPPPLPPPMLPPSDDDEEEWEIVTSTTPKAFDFEPAARGLTSTSHVVVSTEEAEVMDFTANIIEMAFARASEKVLGEQEASVTKVLKKISEDHNSSCRSPVIGGA